MEKVLTVNLNPLAGMTDDDVATVLEALAADYRDGVVSTGHALDWTDDQGNVHDVGFVTVTEGGTGP